MPARAVSACEPACTLQRYHRCSTASQDGIVAARVVRPEPAVPVFLLLFLASACVRPIAAFTCADSTQCNGGICQPTGLCSFDDPGCASGQRYGAASGDASDVCVDVDPPMCDLAQPFGTPDLVAGIQSTTEDGTLRLSVDEKTGDRKSVV